MILSKKQRFIIDVSYEIELLIRHCTEKEIAQLNEENFSKVNISNCVYGQLTGSAKSQRARKLMDLCAIRSIYNDYWMSISILSPDDHRFVSRGLYHDEDLWKNDERTFEYLTSLEAYLFTKNSDPLHVIRYMKNKDTVLKLYPDD